MSSANENQLHPLSGMDVDGVGGARMATTLAIGEEGNGCWRPGPIFTTKALGEEGCRPICHPLDGWLHLKK